MRRTALSLLTVLVTPHTLMQSHPLIGEWAVRMPVGVRLEGGANTDIVSPGTLRVTAAGDSLIGILQLDALENRPRPRERRLAGVRSGETVTFAYAATAQISENGETTTRPVITTYTLTAHGDSLSGLLKRVVESSGHLPDLPEQRISGTRRRP